MKTAGMKTEVPLERKNKNAISWRHPGNILYAAVAGGGMLGLYASSLHSYILFHSLVEITTIAIAFTLFIFTWNTRRYLTGGCLKILGIGYGLIAGIDLVHTLAYKGMGVFPTYGANLPTQLWIAARSLQALLLCVAPLFVRRDINERVFFGLSLAVVSGTTILVFAGHFPDCFIEGKGLTPFKIISEYIISAILVASLLLFIGRRAAFSTGVFMLIVISLLCTIGSELAFTTYLSVYGPANMVGHFLKLAAFYLIYRAVVVTGFKEPFELIFQDLRQAKEELTREREFSRSLLDSMADGVVACDADGILALFNRAAREWHYLDPMKLPTEEWARHYDLYRADGVTPLPTDEIPLAMAFRGEAVKDAGMAIVARGQEPRYILANGSRITDEAGRKLGAVVVMRDITAFRRLEQELRQTNVVLERRVEERTAELRASEERFRTLFEAVPDALVIADLDTGVIAAANPSAERLFGQPREALIGLHQSGLHPPALLERAHASFREHAELARTGKGGGPFEHVILRSDGAEIPVEIMIQPVTLTGRPMIQGAFRDITERKRAEETLHRLNRELHAVSNCNQALMKAEDEQTLLVEICRIICDEAGYRMAWVGYAEHDPEKTIRPVAWAGENSDYVAGLRLSWSEEMERGRGPAGIAIRSGEPVHVQDFAIDARLAPWRQAALARGFRSGIALPLKDEKATVFGVLLIYSSETYAVTAEEFKLLEELAGDLAFGITALRNRAELKRTENVAQARLRMLEAVYTTDLSMDDTLRLMLDEIETQTRSSIAFYHFLEEDQQTLSLQNWSSKTLTTMCTAEGKGRHYPVAEAGVWVDCVRERRPVIHNDYATLPHRKGLPAGHAPVVRELVIPVFRGPRIVAVIGVGNKPDEYNETDARVASLLGDFSWEIVTRKRAEEAYRISVSRFGELFNKAAIPLCFVNKEGARLTFNSRFEKTFGYSPAEAPSLKEWWQLAYPDPDYRERVLETCDAVLQRAVEARKTDLEPIEYRVTCKNGETRTMVVFGNFIGEDLLLTFFDVTGRKQAEEEILRLNERFMLAAGAAGLGVWDWDIRKNELVWDDRMYDLYGIKKGDFAGAYEAWLAGVHPDDRDRCDEASEQARRGEREYDTEFRVVWPDGSIHYLKAYGLVIRDLAGAPLRMTGVNFDITARKAADEALHHLTEELEQRVRERTAELEAKNEELERMNQLFVGRELRMVELKRKIKELEVEKPDAGSVSE